MNELIILFGRFTAILGFYGIARFGGWMDGDEPYTERAILRHKILRAMKMLGSDAEM